MNSKKLIIASIITTIVFLIIRFIGIINKDLFGLDILFAIILLIRQFAQLKSKSELKIENEYKICIISNVAMIIIFLLLALIKHCYLPDIKAVLTLKDTMTNTSYFIEMFFGYFAGFSIIYLLLNILITPKKEV